MKKPWRDGTRFVVFEPDELMARLCAMVPPPWFHMIRFHGVLAPNAKLRNEVVPSARPSEADASSKLSDPAAGAEQLSLFGGVENAAEASPAGSRKPWAWLLRHVFATDVTVCPRCSGAMRWLAIATTPDDIADSLARAGPLGRAPPRKPKAPHGQLTLGFPS
jgi:hypothetical protein